MAASPKKFFTPAEAAALLMVSPVTLREWARKGLLPSVSTVGGHRRFLLETLREFAGAHGISIEEPGARAEPAAGPLRVLIVDDDTVFSDYLRELVRKAEPTARISLAADGFEAGQLSESLRPELVTVDLNMPRIDGLELCRRLRQSEATAQARLVLISGALTEEVTARARTVGADAWLDKGASRAEILRVLGLNPAARVAEPVTSTARRR